MSENRTLRIHTQMGPEAAPEWKPGPARARHSRRKRKGPRALNRPKLSSGDRLMRNSAIACAVLLGVLALGNVDRPWATKAAESIEQALTMHIDLDDSLGGLTFVRDLMPESALVFLNVSGGQGYTRPTDGERIHDWTSAQPWVIFSTNSGDPVYAVAPGTVSAVSPLSEGRFGLLIDHGEGVETLYASLAEAAVKAGDTVARGQEVGCASDCLYFEYREGGESLDPQDHLGWS